jgi:N-acetylneuraminic acid mutarotase
LSTKKGGFMQLLLVTLLFSLVWTTKTPLPQVLAGSGCAVFNDSIYVIGGRDQSSRYTTNYVYDPLTDNWSTKTNMSVARAHIGAGVVNGKMYVIGGWVGSSASDVVEEYDPATDTWTTKTSMPTPRYAYAMAVVTNKIYVMGGMDMNGNIFNTVEEYDPGTDTWTAKTPMPTARMGPACAVIRDTIYVFGGSTSIGSPTAINQCYDPGSDIWTSRLNMQNSRYCLGGFAFGDEAYAVGGYDYYNYHTTVEVYNPTLNTWVPVSSMQYARQSIAVGLKDDCVYVIGGWNNGPVNYNEEGWVAPGIQEYSTENAINIQVGPNPFSGTTRISIAFGDMNIANFCNIAIFDISGRLVRNIAAPITTAHTTVEWDGKNNNGNDLPSGTYMLLVRSQGVKQIQKLLLVR